MPLSERAILALARESMLAQRRKGRRKRQRKSRPRSNPQTVREALASPLLVAMFRPRQTRLLLPRS